jgi:hypothetical protein
VVRSHTRAGERFLKAMCSRGSLFIDLQDVSFSVAENGRRNVTGSDILPMSPLPCSTKNSRDLRFLKFVSPQTPNPRLEIVELETGELLGGISY